MIVVMLFLFFFAGKHVPAIPSDNLHAIITSNVACIECHALGKPQPLKDAHPRKDQCIDCHKTEKTKKPATVGHS